MLGMITIGFTVMTTALMVSLAPNQSAAVSLATVSVHVNNGTSTRTILGTSKHHLVIEALASASASLNLPFAYQLQGSSIVTDTMFGHTNDEQGRWSVALNGTPLTNLDSITFSARDEITVTRTPLK